MKRIKAFVVAALFAVALGSAMDIIYNPCLNLDPDSWIYWLLGCPGTSGGGGSGAGD